MVNKIGVMKNYKIMTVKVLWPKQILIPKDLLLDKSLVIRYGGGW